MGKDGVIGNLSGMLTSPPIPIPGSRDITESPYVPEPARVRLD